MRLQRCQNMVMTLLGLFGLAGLFCLPFLVPVHTAPLSSFYGEWLAAVLGVVFAILLLQKRALQRLELPKIAILPIGIFILLWLQAIYTHSSYIGQYLLSSLYLLLAVLLMTATRAAMRDLGLSKIIVVVAWATLVGGVINGVIAIMQTWNLHDFLGPLVARRIPSVVYGNLAQPNHFANHQALAIAALLFLLATKKIKAISSAIFGLVLLVGLVLSASRSGLLYLASFALISLMFAREAKSEESTRLQWISFLLIPAYFVVQLGMQLMPEVSTPLDRHLSQSVFNVRYSLWLGAMHMFAEAPLIGVGHYRFADNYFQYLSSVGQALEPSLSPTYAHNILFQLVAEFGLAGLVLCIFAGYRLFQIYRRVLSPERWMALAMLAVLVIHGLLEYPLHYMYFLATTAVLLAISEVKPFEISTSLRYMRLALSGTLLIGGVFLAVMLPAYRALEKSYSNIDKSWLVEGARDAPLLETAQSVLVFEPEVDNVFNSIKIDPGEPKKWRLFLEVSERAIKHKVTASRIYRHVLLLALNERHAEASSLLTKAVRVYPVEYLEFRRQLRTLRDALPSHLGLNALWRLDMSPESAPDN